MIYLLYSNDYEVFLGGNYRPEQEILLKKTEEVMTICQNADFPMTFFTDVACLWRYQELGRVQFVKETEEQLQLLVRSGHDVQAHLHPHWFQTTIEDCENGTIRYHFDLNSYLLGNAIAGKGGANGISDLLGKCKTYLERLLCPDSPSYKCVAFRAGGYGLQPGEKAILAALQKEGFVIDSSVVPGMEMKSNVNRIDFRRVPDRENYYLSSDEGLSTVADNGIFEIPIVASSGLHGPLFKKIFRKGIKQFQGRREPREWTSGFPIQMAGGRFRNQFTRVTRLALHLLRGWYMLELSDDVESMVSLTRHYIERFDHQERPLFLSFSCHSKSTNKENLNALEQYHKIMKAKYTSEISAITYQEAARIVQGSDGVR